MEYLIGIDVGTSSVKASLFDVAGNALASASKSYPTKYPGFSMAEQSPEDWWNAALYSLRSITSSFDISAHGAVRGIAVSCQTPSLVALDKAGACIRPAIIWMDRRTNREVHEILDRISETTYTRILGSPPDAFYLLPKLLWYRKNEPTHFANTHVVLQANSYIAYKLCGELSTDFANALVMQCADVEKREWAYEISDLLGLEFARILPRLYPCHEVIGQLTKSAARATGLPENIPIVAGTNDTVASIIGVGAVQPYVMTDITGTSSLCCLTHDKPITACGRLPSRRSPIEGVPQYLMAPISASGASVKWFAQNFAQTEQTKGGNIFDALDALAATSTPGAHGLFYHPYMTGERAPLWNTHAKGMFIGLTLDSKREDLMRAIYEGTAYALRHVREEAHALLNEKPFTVRAGGGGAKAEEWLQVKASVLKSPIEIIESNVDSAVRGDAIIAGYATGVYASIEDACRNMIHVHRVVEPLPAWSDVYDALYPYYVDFYRALDNPLQQLEQTLKTLKQEDLLH